ncbi:MAG: DUF389 domain-containing protein [Burkholderiaceae bacterium]
MKYVEIVASEGSTDTTIAMAQSHEAADLRLGLVDEEERRSLRVLIADHKLQALLDSLQKITGAQPTAHIAVLPVEIALPASSPQERREEDSAAAARESLYSGVERNTQLDQIFIVLLLLSTIVAAIGLIESNVAVIIGAMVIAPLLGPNLAFGLGTALGDLFGIMLGNGDWTLATGAGLLLAVNVVCVNLSCKLVFFVKGIRPRTWWEKKKASRTMTIYIAVWAVTLLALIAVILARNAIT